MHIKRAAAILCAYAQLTGIGAMAAEIPKETSQASVMIPSERSVNSTTVYHEEGTKEADVTADAGEKTALISETENTEVPEETVPAAETESVQEEEPPEYTLDDRSAVVDETDAKLKDLLNEYYAEGEGYTVPDEQGQPPVTDGNESDSGSGIVPMRAATVKKSPHTITVAGTRVDPQRYLIYGNNYFKLRDIAYLLSRYSVAPFNVEWDNAKGAVNITTGSRYIVEGGEMATYYPQDPVAKPSTAKLLVDGKSVSITGFFINGNNYYRIVDIAELVGFDVSYDNKTSNVNISAKVVAADPVTPEEPETPVKPTTPETPVIPPTQTIPVTPPTPTNPIIPSTSFKAGVYKVNVHTFLNVRSGPGITFSGTGKLNNGDSVVVDSLSGEWGHLLNGGYCKMEYLIRQGDYVIGGTPTTTPVPELPVVRTSQLDGKKMVIIDAGHGGSDAGAGSSSIGLYEKYVNFEVSLYLKQYLEAEGVEVAMVRESVEDTGELYTRGNAMDQYIDKVDLFFSIHHNAANGSARGAQVLCQIADENGGPTKLLAYELGKEYAKLGLSIRDPWFRRGTNDPTSDYYYITNQAKKRDIVAVISEFCFIDNYYDAQYIDSEEDLQAEARAQCNAIMNYFAQTEY